MTNIQEKRDQLETRLDRADAVLTLLASAQDVDPQTLQSVALDAADHIKQAREIYQVLASAQQKGPALSRQPFGCITCLSVSVGQRPPAA